MKLRKSFLAILCALSLTCSICVNAETSKTRDYDVIISKGDDGMTVTVTEREPEDTTSFDPEGTVVKDVVYDYPESVTGKVVVEISVPKGTKNLKAYVDDGGWHELKVKVKKDRMYVPIVNHQHIIYVVTSTGKSPKTGETTDYDYTLLMDGLLIGAASIGAVICYRKKEVY